MKYTELSNLSDVLEEGFFSDKVVDLLKEKKPLNADSEKTLHEVLNFLEKARRGEKQVESGKLGSDAIDSIGAYTRAINMIAYQSIPEEKERKSLEDMLNSIDHEVKNAIKKRVVEPSKLQTTMALFKFVKSQTLREASSYYSRKVEVVQWPSLLF